MAEESATALAPIQADLFDFPALLKNCLDGILANIPRQSPNPHCAAVAGLRCLWHCPILADPVRSQRLVLRIINSNGHTLHRCPGDVHCLVHCLGVKELDVAKLAISKLIHLEADHLNLAAGLEKIDNILLLCID